MEFQLTARHLPIGSAKRIEPRWCSKQLVDPDKS